MAQLMRADFIISHDLNWVLNSDSVDLIGHIFCLGKIIIRVEKKLEVLSAGLDPQVFPVICQPTPT